MKRVNVNLRYFKCPNCGTTMSFPKNAGKRTKNGHIKHAYCYVCRDVVPFTQVEDSFARTR